MGCDALGRMGRSMKERKKQNKQTNLAHLHGRSHTPPGPRRHWSTLRRTRSRPWSAVVPSATWEEEPQQTHRRDRRTEETEQPVSTLATSTLALFKL